MNTYWYKDLADYYVIIHNASILGSCIWGRQHEDREHTFFYLHQSRERKSFFQFFCFFFFSVCDRPLFTFNTLMGKESEQKSKMEMVINMLMLGRGAGKSSFYTRPSTIYWRVCACVCASLCVCVCEGGKTEIEKEQGRTGNVHNIACENAHTHTHTLTLYSE